MADEQKVILSGIQASGQLTLGNYLGAIKNWVNLQDDYNCLFCVADLHSITVRQEPAKFRQNAIDIMKIFMASGIDTSKHLLFFQSHVAGHSQLSWILNCYTYMGELSRMTQFKDKSAKNESNINAGLFTYPVLMAADILLYQADLVPVGEDQKQHLEITRDIATRFNSVYGDVFKVPEPYIPKVGARIMSLQEPTQKMSKSDPNPNGFIALLDKPDIIRSKVKKAVTDSEGCVRFAEGKEGINNLITIYSVCSGKSVTETEREFEGKGYGVFKEAVAEAIVACLSPMQEKFEELTKNKDFVEKTYTEAAETASYLASKTLRKVYKKIGFIPKN